MSYIIYVIKKQNIMEYIGKAEKFYTLWEVWEETHTTIRGESYKAIHHQYIKNISFDLDKAKDKYPNAIIDESLRGHSSWTSYDYPKPPVDEFRGGKYRGDKIAECTDYQYLHWAYDLGYIIPWESREIVLGILELQGYRKINDTHIATPEEVERIEKSYTECEEVQKTLEASMKSMQEQMLQLEILKLISPITKSLNMRVIITDFLLIPRERLRELRTRR